MIIKALNKINPIASIVLHIVEWAQIQQHLCVRFQALPSMCLVLIIGIVWYKKIWTAASLVVLVTVLEVVTVVSVGKVWARVDTVMADAQNAKDKTINYP